MTAFRKDLVIINAVGEAVGGALIYVCTQPVSTGLNPPVIPPAPLATLFADSAASIPLANPIVSDGNGNAFFYAATNVYTLIYFDPNDRIPTQVFPDQEVITPGGGSVTSVGVSMPTEFSVSGSPVSISGTIAVSKANQNAGTVYAGPASGPPAPPTFQSLATLASSLGLGAGTVTSVAVSVTPGSLFTASFTGGPITASGTLALSFDFNTQAANKVIAGPVSGGLGAVTARFLVPADLPGQTAVAFSATPVFDASSVDSFTMTLTGDVTSSSVTNPTTGQTITFILLQDGVGNHAFAWPANFLGASAIAPEAGLYSVQSFIYDGTSWHATGPGSTH